MTFEQAKALQYRQEVHCGECVTRIGPRGGSKTKTETWRVNGQVKLWKTRPEEIEVPVKYGFNGPYTYIRASNLDQWHLASECSPRVIGGTRIDAGAIGVQSDSM
jgi:hypothetical protein